METTNIRGIDARCASQRLNSQKTLYHGTQNILNLFICGTGTVGSSLAGQIEHQQLRLLHENGLYLKVAGIANGKYALFRRDGIDLSTYKDLLPTAGIPSHPETLLNEILKMNLPGSVFIDCTASQSIAGLYNKLLSHGISVVAANKIAASSGYDNYLSLKQAARSRGVKFLFETNVGAGLPVISTINDLVNSGDKILKIEAVLSGTLNYLFNRVGAGIPFSRAVRMALDEGYSEPDPRIDLSGKDVVRKLVILGREAGYRLEQQEVETYPFVPEVLLKGNPDDFWKSLPLLDPAFEARRKELERTSRRLRYVARLEAGKASAGLQEIAPGHPFYNLEDSNNILMITTRRYRDYPMLIQGYGAGAGVTAAGIFANILSIANI